MFPIKGFARGKQDYKQEAKRSDEHKYTYHQWIAKYVNDLHAYNAQCGYGGPLDVLTLESVDLASTRVLVEQCGVPLDHIDIVSRNVEFKAVSKKIKTGDLYTGELYDYLLNIRPTGGYDVIIFDFCGVWATQKHCVKRVFDMQLLDECAFITVTCCARNNTRDKSEYQWHDYDKCEDDVREWAKANGYRVAAHHSLFRYESMFCIFFKVIHCKTTMSYKGGIRCKRTAADWLREPLLSSSPPPPLRGGGGDNKEERENRALAIKPTVGKHSKKIGKMLEKQVMRFRVL